jgi:hypothetical protein
MWCAVGAEPFWLQLLVLVRPHEQLAGRIQVLAAARSLVVMIVFLPRLTAMPARVALGVCHVVHDDGAVGVAHLV